MSGDGTYQNPKPQTILDKRGAASARRILESGEIINTADVAASSAGIFGGMIVEPRTPVIELNSALPLSVLRDDRFTDGAATIDDTADPGSYRLRHTTGGDMARLESQRRGRYQPGAGAFAGVGMYLEGGPIADPSARAEWGYFDSVAGGTDVLNGFLFGVDSGGLYIRVVRGGSETFKVYQDDWNVPGYRIDDIFDGVGRAFQVRYAYYGIGPVIFQVSDPALGQSLHVPKVVHVWRPTTGVSIDNPNLKIGGLVSSDAGSDAFDLHILGRHYQTEGEFEPIQRITSANRYRTNVGTTVVPLISFRKKSGFRQITVGPSSFGAIVAQNDMRLQIRVNSTLTGDSFGAVPETDADETSLEVDISASAIDTGTGLKLYETLASAGQSAQGAILQDAGVFAEIPDDATITLCAATRTGTGNVWSVFRLIEEF